MAAIRMAQYGTKHGHAAGKLAAMQKHPDVEVVGVYEPDATRRTEVRSQPGPFARVNRWFDSGEELFDDSTIVAVASEGLNSESLGQTEAIVRTGKHVWYDKPAGEDWPRWQAVVADAKRQNLLIQMGYMFRYHEGFVQIADWVKRGLLGRVFSVRAHMSTSLSLAQREVISEHEGGIFYDLAGHMIDQIVWLLGRPNRVHSYLRNDSGEVPKFNDNTLGVFEFDHALAFVDIAAMEPRPMARRFEVYGTEGSAILVEPFEPAHTLRLCLTEAKDGYKEGEQLIPVRAQSRQETYELELAAFLATIGGVQAPDRTFEHELTVQETLLRAVGSVEA